MAFSVILIFLYLVHSYIFIQGFDGLQIHHRVVHSENSWGRKHKIDVRPSSKLMIINYDKAKTSYSLGPKLVFLEVGGGKE